jgi:hypothetical protein
MGDQADDKQNQENKEQKFGNAYSCESNGPKPEQPGDYRDDQKNQRVIKHSVSFPGRRTRRWICAQVTFSVAYPSFQT